ncbi:hypothetical protein [Leptospira alstonii]|uniref:hypothetical protein n=1 Tax=Leptospira alstonii TaxID=28452 RepID=UPI0005619E06|nr:hypothetical protein [Leptospira alstonii]
MRFIKLLKEIFESDHRSHPIIQDFVYEAYREKSLSSKKDIEYHRIATGDSIRVIHKALREIEFTKLQRRIVLQCCLKLVFDPIYNHLTKQQQDKLHRIGRSFSGENEDWKNVNLELTQWEQDTLDAAFIIQLKRMEKLHSKRF